jgi:hypothetical protein
MDWALRRRDARIRKAPRVGSEAAKKILTELFAGGSPVVMEAYFFRCGCSSDYYFLQSSAAFTEAVKRFSGDNPELLLWPVERLVSWSEPEVAGKSDDPGFLEKTGDLADESCALVGWAPGPGRKTWVLFQDSDDLRSWAAGLPAGTYATAYHVRKLTEKVKGVLVMPTESTGPMKAGR